MLLGCTAELQREQDRERSGTPRASVLAYDQELAREGEREVKQVCDGAGQAKTSIIWSPDTSQAHLQIFPTSLQPRSKHSIIFASFRRWQDTKRRHSSCAAMRLPLVQHSTYFDRAGGGDGDEQRNSRVVGMLETLQSYMQQLLYHERVSSACSREAYVPFLKEPFSTGYCVVSYFPVAAQPQKQISNLGQMIITQARVFPVGAKPGSAICLSSVCRAENNICRQQGSKKRSDAQLFDTAWRLQPWRSSMMELLPRRQRQSPHRSG